MIRRNEAGGSLLRRARTASFFAVWVAAPLAAAPLPAEQTALLLFRVLAYDRNLAARAGERVRVLVLGASAECSAVEQALATAAGKLTVAGLPAEVERVATVDSGLAVALKTRQVAALYLCSDRQTAAADVAAAARGAGVLTFTSESELVRELLSIGLVRGATKGEILVNLPNIRAEGSALDAAVLRMCTLVKR